ncbi:MAG: TIGR02253 family HAD-type hydrolase [Promethearchaeota archaeon]
MIKAVGFDLDDTLFNATWLSNKARIGGLKKMIEFGLNIEIKQAFPLLLEVVQKYGSNYPHHFDEFLKELKEDRIFNLGEFSIPKYVAAGVWGYHSIKEKYLKPFGDVIKTLKWLKNKKIIIAILSNGLSVKQYEKILRLGIDKYINFVFISEEIKFEKPNKEFFEYCLKKMDIDPNECMYVGDRFDKDILPTYKMQMIPVLIHRKGRYDPDINKEQKFLQIKEKSSVKYYEIYRLTEIIKIIKKINQEK